MKNIVKIIIGYAISILVLSSCEGTHSTFLINDPEGTEAVLVVNDSSSFVKFGEYQMGIDQLNNFVSPQSNLAFLCYGKTEYLLAIDSLLSSGWRAPMSVLPKYGYAVRLGKNGEDGYARLVVQEYSENHKGIAGAVIKYQYPWHPSNEESIIFIEDRPSVDPDTPDDPPTLLGYDEFWNNSSWYFTGEMSCDGSGEQSFSITFYNVREKTYTSDLQSKYWLATSLEWEDYGGRRITLRGYDDGGHTSFDFDYVNQTTVECEYHHWDRYGNFCKANFIGHRIK